MEAKFKDGKIESKEGHTFFHWVFSFA